MPAQRLGQVSGVGEVVPWNSVGVLAVDGAGPKTGVTIDLDLGKLICDCIEAGWQAERGWLEVCLPALLTARSNDSNRRWR